MILVLRSGVNEKMLESLVTALNSLNEEEELIIYFSSRGGNILIMEAIVNVINQNAHRILFIAFEEIMSAGFRMFFKVNCRRELVPQTIGMAHMCYQKLEFNEMGKPVDSNEKFHYDYLPSTIGETIEFYKSIGLSKDEMKRFKKGEDIWFGYERLKELFESGVK